MGARVLVGGCLGVFLLPAPAAWGETLRVYSSLPLHGASRTQTTAAVKGMRLAVQQAGGRAGPFDVQFISLDDSTRAAGNWDPGQAAHNARRAASDARTILYLGEFNSGASAITIPILNEAGIAQISPSNTYNGLTTGEAGTERGEPEKYYPTGIRTYLRIVPRDTVQSAALLTQMRNDGCRRATVVSDGDVYGASIAGGVRRDAGRIGVPIVRYVRDARDVRASRLAQGAARASSDCFLFAGVTANRAAGIVQAVGRRLPHARLYGADGVCETGFTRHIRRLAARFRCTVATLPLGAYPGGAGFVAAYRQAFGGGIPDAYAIYGYETMKLGLDVIAGLGDRGGDREAVGEALRAVRDRQSVLGTYSLTETGDTTLRTYGIYRATRAGGLAFDRAVVAA